MSAADTTTRRVTLLIPSDLAFLGVPDALLGELASELPYPRAAVEELGTAVIEACTNAMEHGHGLRAEREVEVRFTLRPGAIEVTVLDHGPGFDYAAWTPPTDLLRERGRGLIIMREMTDALRFGRTDDGRFRVHLVKRFPAPES